MELFKALLFLSIGSIALVVAHRDDCRKVDGGLTNWTQYTPCSKSCGNGVQKRYRYCASPYPQNGGKPCFGRLEETRVCRLKACNDKPCVPEWGKWVCGPCAFDQNDKRCKEKCTRKCMINDDPVSNHNCNHLPGGSKKYGNLCPPGACPSHIDTACDQCHQIALDEAKLKTGHWKTDWVGHPCRDSELNGVNLAEICRQKKGDLSITKNTASGHWFYIQCSADGPWCKPCATRNLVFNKKCDACEATHNGPCTGK